MPQRNLLSFLTLMFITCMLLAARGDVFVVGEKILAKKNGSWVRAEVKKKEGDSYYIHYIGASEDDDIWVSVYQMQKMKKFGSDFSTSKKNTRAYKIRSEVEYFCKKDIQFKKLKKAKAKSYFKECAHRQLKESQSKQVKPIARFNPQKPYEFDIHQACMGDTAKFCADKCGEFSRAFCLPQCLEKIQKCKSNFWYDVDVNKHCNDRGAAEWQMENYNKNFDKGGRSIWILPSVYFDDRKDKTLYSCAARFAKRMDERDNCIQLERCSAVCQVDPQSQEQKTIKACQKKCREWFPTRRCKSFVKYRY